MKTKKIVLLIMISAIISVGILGINRGNNSRCQSLLDLGNKALMSMDYEEAVVAFDNAIKINPKSVQAYLGIAEAYTVLNDYIKACEYLEAGYQETEDTSILVMLEPLRVKQYISLGNEYLVKGDPNAAKDAFEKALEKETSNEEAKKGIEDAEKHPDYISDINSKDESDGDLKENVPTWYMDSEGIKNNTLSIVIEKENKAVDEIEIYTNFGVAVPNEAGNGYIRSQEVYTCGYYEGSLDDYISENEMQKDKLGDIEYAYLFNENINSWNIAFVGNGIVVTARLSEIEQNETVNEYLNKINLISTYSEENINNCLAYIAEDGLYCPALGIKFSVENSKNSIARRGVKCILIDYLSPLPDEYYEAIKYISVSEDEYRPMVYISIDDESVNGMGAMFYMVDANSAQEIVNKYVVESLKPDEFKTIEYNEIGGIEEINLGDNLFLGRGLVGKYEWENEKREYWLFCSDGTTWSVSINYLLGNKYTDFIHVLEKME